MKRGTGSFGSVIVATVICVGVALVVVACGTSAAAPHQGTLRADGAVMIGGRPVSASAVQLELGDDVTVTNGTADVKLADGGLLELRAGSTVLFDDGPQLQNGDLLVESTHAPVSVGTAVGVVSVDGVARLRRDLALEVGTYEGSATIEADRTVTIPGLEEDTIPAVGVVPTPTPLQLDPTDAWDQQFMGVAIDLTSELDGESRYVTANTPAATAASATFYRMTLPGLAVTPTFTQALLTTPLPGDNGPPAPGDALVAASIALGGHGAFIGRWDTAFALREQGAQWGIVVLDEDANPATVISLVGQAVDAAALGPPSQPVVDVDAGLSHQLSSADVALALTSPAASVATTTRSVAAPVTRHLPSAPAHHPAQPTTSPTTTPPATGATTTVPPHGDVLAPVLDPLLDLVHGLLPG